MSDEVKEASKGGIPITSLNPDTDGDGKVEKWEMDVFNRIKKADEDRSGAISVKEVRACMLLVRAHHALLFCFCSDDRRAGKVAARQGPRWFFSAELYALRPRPPRRLRQLGRTHSG